MLKIERRFRRWVGKYSLESIQLTTILIIIMPSLIVLLVRMHLSNYRFACTIHRTWFGIVRTWDGKYAVENYYYYNKIIRQLKCLSENATTNDSTYLADERKTLTSKSGSWKYVVHSSPFCFAIYLRFIGKFVWLIYLKQYRRIGNSYDQVYLHDQMTFSLDWLTLTNWANIEEEVQVPYVHSDNLFRHQIGYAH